MPNDPTTNSLQPLVSPYLAIAAEISRILGRVEAMATEMCAKPAPLSQAGFRDYIREKHQQIGLHLEILLQTSTPNSPQGAAENVSR